MSSVVFASLKTAAALPKVLQVALRTGSTGPVRGLAKDVFTPIGIRTGLIPVNTAVAQAQGEALGQGLARGIRQHLGGKIHIK